MRSENANNKLSEPRVLCRIYYAVSNIENIGIDDFALSDNGLNIIMCVHACVRVRACVIWRR